MNKSLLQAIDNLLDYKSLSGAILSAILIFHLMKQPIQQTHRYKIVSKQVISQQMFQFILQPLTTSKLYHQPGQYIEIVHSTSESKPYSVANPDNTDGIIELHIRINENACGLTKSLAIEQELTLIGPFGDCTLPQSTQEQVLMIAGGTGFVPFSAIIRTAYVKKQHRLTLFWGAKTKAELYYMPQLNEIATDYKKFEFIPVIEQASVENWSGKIGSVVDHALKQYHMLQGKRIYLSGPMQMVELAKQQLIRQGLPIKSIYSDLFDYKEKIIKI